MRSDEPQNEQPRQSQNRADIGDNANVGQIALGNNINQYLTQYQVQTHASPEEILKIKQKFESLVQLDKSLQEAFRTLNLYGNMHISTRDEYDTQLRPKMEDFLRSVENARKYLSEEEFTIINHTRAQFQLTDLAIFVGLPPHERGGGNYDATISTIDWKEFVESYRAASNCMRALLNPSLSRSSSEGSS